MGRKKPSIFLRVLIPLAIVVAWLGVGGVGGPYFGRIEEVSQIDLAAFLPKSAEATKVNEQVKNFRDSSVLPALLVFSDKDGTISEADATRINDVMKTFADQHPLPQPISPAIIADDKQAALVSVPLDSNKSTKKELAALTKIVDRKKLGDLSYKISGPAGFSRDLNKAFAGIDGLLLVVALAVVFVILLVVYRSPVLPIIVLLTSMVALTGAIFVVWQLAHAGIIQLNGQVQGILFILVIGAATDYSLLYVARYREELLHLPHRVQATGRALKGSFEPILASSSTVIVGLFCLLISDLASNKALGPVGSIGVAMAVLSALTFLPAVLVLMGRWAFWPFRPRYSEATATVSAEKLHGKLWPRVAKIVSTAPRFVWIGCVALLLAASFFAPQLRADGISQSELVIGKSEARDGQKLLSKHFPAGAGSPVLVLVPQAEADRTIAALEQDGSVDAVYAASKTTSAGQLPLGKAKSSLQDKIRGEIIKQQDAKLAEIRSGIAVQNPYAVDEILAGIRSQMPSADELTAKAYPFKDATPTVVDGKVLLQVTLRHGPDTQAAKDAVKRIRSLADSIDPAVLVGGVTAIQLDTNTASIHDRSAIIPLVLIAITIILMLLLRSILAPILILLTTIVSFTATLGISAILFQNILQLPGMDPSVVLYGFVFLVALGIDYNIFLMTRVREETLKTTTRKGVLKALVVTGGVITSAGVVLAATFAALSVIPILFLVQLAFIVAFGVLLDTLIVRSLIVPALIYDLGKIVWWPAKHK